MKNKKFYNILLSTLVILLFQSCQKPEEEIKLRQIRDVVADISTEPTLKAEAIFFNPNDIRGKLKHISVDIYVNGKKAGTVKKDYKVIIPRNGEFTVPIEVKLNIKELGTLNSILGMVSGKKFDVRYDGYLRVIYRGFPIRVPVDYKDEVRIRL
jgi:LEA14-like dessication related protein